MTQTLLSAARSIRRGEKLPTLACPEARRARPGSRRACPEARRALNFPRKPLASSLASLRISCRRLSLATSHSSLATSVLIHGSAIKTRTNLHFFNHMQISNRRQTGGKPPDSACLPTETRDALRFSIFPSGVTRRKRGRDHCAVPNESSATRKPSCQASLTRRTPERHTASTQK
jgi:hypothetical protein